MKRVLCKLLWRYWRRSRRYRRALDKIIDQAPTTRPSMWNPMAERYYRSARWRDAEIARRAIRDAESR